MKLKAFGQAEIAQHRASLIRIQSSNRTVAVRAKAERRRRSQEQLKSSKEMPGTVAQPSRGLLLNDLSSARGLHKDSAEALEPFKSKDELLANKINVSSGVDLDVPLGEDYTRQYLMKHNSTSSPFRDS